MAIPFAVGIVALFLLAGLWLLFVGRRSAAQARASRSWPSVPGTIVKSALVSRSVSFQDSDDKTDYFTPKVQYAYTVAGSAFEGSVIRFGSLETSDRDRAQAYCNRYPVGTQVDIRYDPANPAIATLETDAETGMLVWLGYGLIAGGILVALAWGTTLLRG